jgi:hypothetical protein
MRRATQARTRPCGVGADGNEYGVTELRGTGGAYMRRPCATCPWRTDQPTGRFPAQAYRESAHTAYDASFHTFACHTAGAGKPATCAGFLLRNADNNIGVRLAVASGRIDLRQVDDGGHELYSSYREMAVANGVPADDPVLQPCRADGE